MRLLVSSVAIVLVLVVIYNSVDGYVYRKERRQQHDELRVLCNILTSLKSYLYEDCANYDNDAIDPCVSLNCKNNGTCLVDPGDNSPICRCVDGFKGDNCEDSSCNAPTMIPGDGIDNNCDGQIDEEDCRYGQVDLDGNGIVNEDCKDPCFDPTICPGDCVGNDDGSFKC